MNTLTVRQIKNGFLIVDGQESFFCATVPEISTYIETKVNPQ